MKQGEKSIPFLHGNIHYFLEVYFEAGQCLDIQGQTPNIEN
jgi:hypothetical protein